MVFFQVLAWFFQKMVNFSKIGLALVSPQVTGPSEVNNTNVYLFFLVVENEHQIERVERSYMQSMDLSITLRPWIRNVLKSWKFFRVYLQLLNLQLPLQWSHLLLKSVFLQFIIFMFHSLYELRWTQQVGLYGSSLLKWWSIDCSANSKAIGLNPVEIPKFFFQFICNC